MIIKCCSDEKQDIFYVPSYVNDIVTFEKYYIKNDLPIKCYHLNRRYLDTIFLKEEFERSSPCYVNLDNYLYYSVTDKYYIMSIEEYNKILKQCKSCIHKDSMLMCKYEKNKDGNCKRYEKRMSLLEKLGQFLNRKE